jgi:hypothetical protein
MKIMEYVKVQPRENCRTERVSELLRIADERNVLDVVCSIAETFLFGDVFIFKDIKEEIEKTSCDVEKKKDDTRELEKKIDINNSMGRDGRCINNNKPKIVKKIMKKTSVKKQQAPEKNYVQIKWSKIPRGMGIWKEINPSTFEKSFVVQEFDVFEVKQRERKENETMVEIRKPTIFPEKKGYAISIVLGRVKTSNIHLKSSILNLEEEMFDENLVKQLLFYFPSDEEIEQLRETENVFGRGEEFFKECVDEVEMIKKCLYCLYFVLTFRNQSTEIQMETLKKYYTSLLKSESLRRFLGTILYAGNFLNQGSYLGDAEGFSMDSIPKILNTRNNGVSFVDFVMKRVSGESLVKDLDIVYDASRINFEVLCMEVEELKKNYINTSGNSCERIQKRMEMEIPRYERMCSTYDDVVRLYKECERCFGECIDEEFNSRIIHILERISCVEDRSK